MQESLAEITLAHLPLVVLNMARAQGDYYQATRGGGHGDYRHLVLAPMDVPEAVELTQLAFHLADTWRNPVMIFGDYYLAHTYQSVDVQPIDFGPVPVKGPPRLLVRMLVLPICIHSANTHFATFVQPTALPLPSTVTGGP